MKEIVQEGASILREIAKPVPENLFGSVELSSLIRDMSEALDAFPEGVELGTISARRRFEKRTAGADPGEAQKL